MSFEQLIEEVRKYPCLWNKSLEEYRNQNMRDNAWDVISGNLSKHVGDLKTEWKKLQDSHRQAISRRKTKSGQCFMKMKPWKYEAQMSFLLSDLIPRETQSNVEENEARSGLLFSEVNEEVEVEEQPHPEMDNSTESGKEKGRKAFYQFKRGLDKECDVDKVITFIAEKNKGKKQPGEIDFVFASACESTKRLPHRLQIKVKQAVMKTVLDAELESLRSDLPVTRPTSSSTLSCQTSPPSHMSSEDYHENYTQNQTQRSSLNCSNNDNNEKNSQATFFYL